MSSASLGSRNNDSSYNSFSPEYGNSVKNVLIGSTGGKL